MTLLWLILIPLIGGAVAWAGGRRNPLWTRWVSLVAMGLHLALGISFCFQVPPAQSRWLQTLSWQWLPSVGIRFELALDGLSLLLVLLTGLLGLLSVIASWRSVAERVGYFHFNLLWVLAGITGVFLAMDLFFFFFFWELMIVPMYFLIGIWGHERKDYAAIKFFLFTQASGLLMLVAILGLYFLHGQASGEYTFRYEALLGHRLPADVAFWLMLGFLIAFAVKLPSVPFHTWLADAHTEAPTAGSVILAGLLLKTGAYGLIRFAVPLFPAAAAEVAPFAMGLGVVSILYGAKLAFAQRDFKRLVAYTSVSHMGFVLLGVFAGNVWALQGAVMQMICHGLSTGALFIVAGELQDRLHTRDLDRMGGWWQDTPRMAGVTLFFALASLGLPGLGNFVGEFLVLLGAFQSRPTLAVLAALGLVAAAVYSLWLVQQIFHGERRATGSPRDFAFREMGMLGVLMVALVWLGLRPQPVLDLAQPALDRVQSDSNSPTESTRAARQSGEAYPAGRLAGASWFPGPTRMLHRRRDTPPVAQVANLLYRRLPVGRTRAAPLAPEPRGVCGLEIRDTADWKSALRTQRCSPPVGTTPRSTDHETTAPNSPPVQAVFADEDESSDCLFAQALSGRTRRIEMRRVANPA